MTEAELYEELGQLVRLHRERLQMSQEALSKTIKLSRASIANIETGRQRIPLHHLYQLAQALKVEVETLLPNPKRSATGVMDRSINTSFNLSDKETAEIARAVDSVSHRKGKL